MLKTRIIWSSISFFRHLDLRLFLILMEGLKRLKCDLKSSPKNTSQFLIFLNISAWVHLFWTSKFKLKNFWPEKYRLDTFYTQLVWCTRAAMLEKIGWIFQKRTSARYPIENILLLWYDPKESNATNWFIMLAFLKSSARSPLPHSS